MNLETVLISKRSQSQNIPLHMKYPESIETDSRLVVAVELEVS